MVVQPRGAGVDGGYPRRRHRRLPACRGAAPRLPEGLAAARGPPRAGGTGEGGCGGEGEGGNAVIVSRVSDRISEMGPRGRLLLALAAFTVCYAPFLWRPVQIDDPLFLWAARHIQSHPLDFYGLTANWFGTVAPFPDVM